ncbi:hypothetical protein AKO1_005768 [Acrasis kona]|uniref:Uncharacterized protein n=1 Tax=Acrasis kona TaxID=1008807 RepID=A0AAW2YJQ7_9EUKA
MNQFNQQLQIISSIHNPPSHTMYHSQIHPSYHQRSTIHPQLLLGHKRIQSFHPQQLQINSTSPTTLIMTLHSQ